MCGMNDLLLCDFNINNFLFFWLLFFCVLLYMRMSYKFASVFMSTPLDVKFELDILT